MLAPRSTLMLKDMRDAEIRGEKTPIVKKEPVRLRPAVAREPYVRPKYTREEIELTHPLAKSPAPSLKAPKEPVAVTKKPVRSRTYIKPLVICVTIAAVGTAGWLTFRAVTSRTNIQQPETSQTNTNQTYSIPVYFPKNLPKDYTYNNDIKSLKKDVYYYSVSGPGNTVFHITQQPLPTDFDFAAFNKKFLNPEKFVTEAGSAIVGPVGPTIIGSIQTVKNSWILVNCENSSAESKAQTVLRSLSL